VPEPIPLCDLTRQAAGLAPDLEAAAAGVLASGSYVLGAQVEAFEREIADFVGAPHAVAVASGTDALELALRAAGVGPGDEVLTTPFTFFATVSAILACGAVPVFADVDPATLLLDPAAAARVLARRRRVRAMVPVHLYGHPAAVDELAALGPPLIEDAAQALGARHRGREVGTLGLAGCFSFFPTKNLGGFGDGGLVTTADADLADRVRLLRGHGARPRYTHQAVGRNSRLDALQAALLRVKLPHVPRWLAARAAHAAAYTRDLAGVGGLTLPCPAEHVEQAWHQYTIRVDPARRDAVRSALDAQGIATGVYYPSPAHLQRALAFLRHGPGEFPAAEAACSSVLSLPLFPELRADERDRVVAALRSNPA
jgi:dTDP-4-amino-4,6-dideoxygalactose transaminase